MDASRVTPTDQVLLVIAGSKGARCNVDITGDRLGKVEWNNKMGKVSSVQIVQKLGESKVTSAASGAQTSLQALVHWWPSRKTMKYALIHSQISNTCTPWLYLRPPTCASFFCPPSPVLFISLPDQ